MSPRAVMFNFTDTRPTESKGRSHKSSHKSSKSTEPSSTQVPRSSNGSTSATKKRDTKGSTSRPPHRSKHASSGNTYWKDSTQINAHRLFAVPPLPPDVNSRRPRDTQPTVTRGSQAASSAPPPPPTASVTGSYGCWSERTVALYVVHNLGDIIADGASNPTEIPS